ncbi:MAG: DUF1501 domain-containing protein [Ornithinimicrobium sp.]
MSVAPTWAVGTGRDQPVLVVISLRGAADGMSLVVPHGDPAYYRARPSIAVAHEVLVRPDHYFGLHPALSALAPLWDEGRLAAVHATGLPVVNRSHFAAMEEVEDAQIGSATRSGWLNRLLGQTPDLAPTAGVSMRSAVPPTSLFGDVPTISVSSTRGVQIKGVSGRDRRHVRRRSLNRMWAAQTGPMGQAVRGAMDVADRFGSAGAEETPRAIYPRSDLGQALSGVASMVRGRVGARVVTVDTGSWDMHTNIGKPSGGPLARSAQDLGDSIAAFFGDLGPLGEHVTVVTLSEFGRRVQENASRGLDHGWGNVMFVAGAGVEGGCYLGRWPGLEDAAPADLTVTTDYRSVLAEIVASRFPGASMSAVFPGFVREHVGVMEGQ